MFGVACHNMSVCSAFSVFCVVRAQLIVLNSSSIPGMGLQVYTLKIDLQVK